MIKIKSLDIQFITKSLIYFVFLYFCLEYKTFEHRLYHAVFKLFSPIASLPNGLSHDYPFYLTDVLIFSGFLLALFYVKSLKSLLLRQEVIFLFFFLTLALISIFCTPYEKDLSRLSRVSSLFFAFLLFILLTTVSSEVLVKRVLLAICIIALLESTLAIYQYFLQKPFGLYKLGEPKFLNNIEMCSRIPSYDGKKWLFDYFRTDSVRLFRAYGSFSHPNILSSFFMTSILGSLFFWTKKNIFYKSVFSVLIILQITALFLTFSRAGIAATLLSTFALVAFMKEINLRSKVLHLIALLVFFLANVVIFYPVHNKRGSFSIENNFSKGSNNERISCNRLAFRIIKEHYFLGIGFDHFIKNAEHFKLKNEKFKVTATIHNIYLLIAAEVGIPGLLFFLAFLFSVIIKIKNQKDDLMLTLIVILIGYLLIGMFDYYYLMMQKGKIMFFGISGLICGYSDYLRKARLAQRDGCCSILYSDELRAKC